MKHAMDTKCVKEEIMYCAAATNQQNRNSSSLLADSLNGALP